MTGNRQNKQKKRKKVKRSSSNSGSEVSPDCKYFKAEDTTLNGIHERVERDTTVSDLLNQANSILYGSNEELNDSINDSIRSEIDSELPSSVFDSFTFHEKSVDNINMASNQTSCDSVSEKLETLLSVVLDLKSNQESMKRMFESKLEKLKTDLMENVEKKIRSLKDEIALDIAQETNRTDQILTSIQSIQTRLDKFEKHVTKDKRNHLGITGHSLDPLDNNEITITASGIPVTEDENVMQKAEHLIQALGETVSQYVQITGTVRLPTRFPNKPGLIKISFQNKEEKICVLRNKMKLKDTDLYKETFIRSSKSRIERLMEINARTILKNLPREQGRLLRVNASGRIIPRQAVQIDQHDQQEHF